MQNAPFPCNQSPKQTPKTKLGRLHRGLDTTLRIDAWNARWKRLQETAWRYLRLRREFAYAVARYRRETGLSRARVAVIAAMIDANLPQLASVVRRSKPHVGLITGNATVKIPDYIL